MERLAWNVLVSKSEGNVGCPPSVWGAWVSHFKEEVMVNAHACPFDEAMLPQGVPWPVDDFDTSSLGYKELVEDHDNPGVPTPGEPKQSCSETVAATTRVVEQANPPETLASKASTSPTKRNNDATATIQNACRRDASLEKQRKEDELHTLWLE